MPNKSLAKRKIGTFVDTIFVVLVVSLSLIPFICLRGWDGYAPENFTSFVYRGENYYIRYSDETIGTDKPHIFFLEGWPIKSLVDMVEFSDYQSYVNGLNLYDDFVSQGRLTDDGLTVSYSDGDLQLTKSIKVTEEEVVVTYESDQPIKLRLSLWRYYFSSVNSSDYKGILQPLTVKTKETLRFEFKDGNRSFRGAIKLSDEPLNVNVSGDSYGLNKILVTYVGSCLSIKIALEGANKFPLKIANKDLLYPLMSTAFGLIYLKVRKYAFMVKIRTNRTRN